MFFWELLLRVIYSNIITILALLGGAVALTHGFVSKGEKSTKEMLLGIGLILIALVSRIGFYY